MNVENGMSVMNIVNVMNETMSADEFNPVNSFKRHESEVI